MRYIFYVLTLLVVFAVGMVVGNVFLPDHAAARSAAVSVPGLPQSNPIFQQLSRASAEQDLTTLNQALSSCPVVVGEEKDKLVNRIKLLFAIQEFEYKKAQLEVEMAKNIDTNRPTAQFIQATAEYNNALENVTKMAGNLFPVSAAETEETTTENTPQPDNPPAAQSPAAETKISTTPATK